MEKWKKRFATKMATVRVVLNTLLDEGFIESKEYVAHLGKLLDVREEGDIDKLIEDLKEVCREKGEESV